ncbi:hypothetical protein BDV98DRAFT_585707 [Pterulicium gracile]|uniref:Uncharacterized protein n=1 Tax=Pterulicium gracile TaxID=1884261 RepID=A0A5C3QAD7_9AGAR|nr:hypothetical protein BDV98DRAFT_585707 [Pterula gracilis]
MLFSVIVYSLAAALTCLFLSLSLLRRTLNSSFHFSSASASSLPPRSGLFARQFPDIIPAVCQSQCTTLTQTLDPTCAADPTCICTNSAFNGIAQCFQCLFDSTPGATQADLGTAQDSLEDLATTCEAQGVNITPPTISSGPGSAADPEPSVGSAADPEPSVGSAADPEPSAGTNNELDSSDVGFENGGSGTGGSGTGGETDEGLEDGGSDVGFGFENGGASASAENDEPAMSPVPSVRPDAGAGADKEDEGVAADDDNVAVRPGMGMGMGAVLGVVVLGLAVL